MSTGITLGGRVFKADSLPDSAFQVFPAGEYQTKITKIEVKATKAGDGQYLSIENTIIGPVGQGKKIFDMIMVLHPNPDAERMGLAKLKELMVACDIQELSMETLQTFVGKNVAARVIVKKDPTYGEQNQVAGYKTFGLVKSPFATEGTPLPAPAPMPEPPKPSAKPVNQPW